MIDSDLLTTTPAPLPPVPQRIYLCLHVGVGSAKFVAWVRAMLPAASRWVKTAIATAEKLPVGPAELALIKGALEGAAAWCEAPTAAAFPRFNPDAWRGGVDYLETLD